MKDSMEILFVDDDRVMRKAYRRLFEAGGFCVREARNGADGVAAFLEKRPDAVILDMMMPKMNGLEVCQAIRAHDTTVPIFFLSCLCDDTKKLRAYDVGADDYIEKGASEAVFLAKLRAILRRKRTSARLSSPVAQVVLGEVRIDLQSRRVFVSGKETRRLTQTENDILRVLSARRGQPLTRQELVAELRGKGYACTASMAYNHIWNLRTKLGPSADWLTSARGIGYSLRNEATAQSRR